VHKVAIVENKFALIDMFVKRGNLFSELARKRTALRTAEMDLAVDGDRGCCCWSTSAVIKKLTAEVEQIREKE